MSQVKENDLNICEFKDEMFTAKVNVYDLFKHEMFTGFEHNKGERGEIVRNALNRVYGIVGPFERLFWIIWAEYYFERRLDEMSVVSYREDWMAGEEEILGNKMKKIFTFRLGGKKVENDKELMIENEKENKLLIGGSENEKAIVGNEKKVGLIVGDNKDVVKKKKQRIRKVINKEQNNDKWEKRVEKKVGILEKEEIIVAWVYSLGKNRWTMAVLEKSLMMGIIKRKDLLDLTYFFLGKCSCEEVLGKNIRNVISKVEEIKFALLGSKREEDPFKLENEVPMWYNETKDGDRVVEGMNVMPNWYNKKEEIISMDRSWAEVVKMAYKSEGDKRNVK